jgi:hypothetical protein
VLNKVRFQKFVQDKFDTIVFDLKTQRDAMPLDLVSPNQPEVNRSANEVSDPDTTMVEASCMDVDMMANESFTETRTITTTLSAILHNDLSHPMRKTVLEKLDDYLRRISDFISDYSLVIRSLMLSLGGMEFVQSNTGVTIQSCQRFKVGDLFPAQFYTSVPNHYTAAPIPPELLSSQQFHQELKELFQDQHLGFVHSTFFGRRGAKKETTDKHPIQNLMHINILPYLSHLTHSHNELPSVLKTNALDKYKVNMANMWTGRTQMNKLLNKLIEVLLKVHLAPTRECKYREYIAKRQESQSKTKNGGNEAWSFINRMDFGSLSRNEKRDTIRSEEYKKAKNQKKYDSGKGIKWLQKKMRNEERISFFKSKMNQVKVSFFLIFEKKKKKKKKKKYIIKMLFYFIQIMKDELRSKFKEDIKQNLKKRLTGKYIETNAFCTSINDKYAIQYHRVFPGHSCLHWCLYF